MNIILVTMVVSKVSLVRNLGLCLHFHYEKELEGKIRYVDLLAGSGTTRIIETGDVVKGSPFAVQHYALRPFDDYILIERNDERYKA